MIDPLDKDAAGIPLPARALMILDENCQIRYSILYPATTGRNFDEILRCVKSLKLTANNGLGTPANWSPGDRVVCTPKLTDEVAQEKYENFKIEQLPSGKAYLKTVDDPVHSK